MRAILLKTKRKGLTVSDRYKPGSKLFKFDDNGFFITDNAFIISRAKGHFDHKMFDSIEEAEKHRDELLKINLEGEQEDGNGNEKENSENTEENNEKENNNEGGEEANEESNEQENNEGVLEVTPEIDLSNMNKAELVAYGNEMYNLGFKNNRNFKVDDMIIAIGEAKKKAEAGE